MKNLKTIGREEKIRKYFDLIRLHIIVAERPLIEERITRRNIEFFRRIVKRSLAHFEYPDYNRAEFYFFTAVKKTLEHWLDNTKLSKCDMWVLYLDLNLLLNDYECYSEALTAFHLEQEKPWDAQNEVV